MSEVITELEDIILCCKKHGIEQIKFKGIELTFFESTKPVQQLTIDPIADLKEQLISDEDMLLWSTDHFNEPKINTTEEANDSIN